MSLTSPALALGPPGTVACQAPLSMKFSRQEHWSGLPFPSSGDFPEPGINLRLLRLLHWQTDSLPLNYLGSPISTLELSYTITPNYIFIFH